MLGITPCLPAVVLPTPIPNTNMPAPSGDIWGHVKGVGVKAIMDWQTNLAAPSSLLPTLLVPSSVQIEQKMASRIAQEEEKRMFHEMNENERIRSEKRFVDDKSRIQVGAYLLRF